MLKTFLLFKIVVLTRAFMCVYVSVRVCVHVCVYVCVFICTRSSTIKQETATSFLAEALFSDLLSYDKHLQRSVYNTGKPECLPQRFWMSCSGVWTHSYIHYSAHPRSPYTKLVQPLIKSPSPGPQGPQSPAPETTSLFSGICLLSLLLTLASP